MSKKTVGTTMVTMMLMVMSLFFIGSTYARYEGTYKGTDSVAIANWKVKVNGQESTSLTLDFVVNENTNVVDNKIAPGTTAKATATIDLTGTETAVDLIVEAKDADFESALEAVGLSKDDVELEIACNGNSEISSVTGSGTTDAPFKIPVQNTAFTETNGKFTVEITLTWKNQEQNNVDDTSVGKNGGTLSIPVDFTVRQHID